MLEEVEDLLHRAIECGALVDPWNMLGFGGQYSLFPAPENSVYDHRIDELIDLFGAIFAVYVQIEKEAAAAGQAAVQHAMSQRLDALAVWWDKFASTEVSSIEGISGRDTPSRPTTWPPPWKPGTAPARRPATWPFGATMPSSSALPRPTPWSSMPCWSSAIRSPPWPCWCSGSARSKKCRWSKRTIPSTTWHWIGWPSCGATATGLLRPPRLLPAKYRTAGACAKFLDYIEANAEEYWQVPQFELAGPAGEQEDDLSDSLDADDLFMPPTRT